MTNRHMVTIAVSAREQANGLSKINAAVNQMDHDTQQNASMVEECNTATAVLAVFRFDDRGDANHGGRSRVAA
jgi:methyl-accepting chemotaxis protein